MVAARADRGRGVLDGHLSRNIPATDPRRRWAGDGAPGPRGSALRCGALGASSQSGGAAMISFTALLPELILSIGGTILMIVSAFAGRRASGLVNWLAVAMLVAATIALVGAPSHSGPIYGGIISADLFASFGKA